MAFSVAHFEYSVQKEKHWSDSGPSNAAMMTILTKMEPTIGHLPESRPSDGGT